MTTTESPTRTPARTRNARPPARRPARPPRPPWWVHYQYPGKGSARAFFHDEAVARYWAAVYHRYGCTGLVIEQRTRDGEKRIAAWTVNPAGAIVPVYGEGDAPVPVHTAARRPARRPAVTG